MAARRAYPSALGHPGAGAFDCLSRSEAAPGSDAAALEPYVRHVLHCFGPGKTLWGSDWPVLELAGAYAAWHTLARNLVAPRDHAALFDHAACKAYRLG